MIARSIHDLCKEEGIACLSACRCLPREPMEDVTAVSSKWDSRLHGQLSRFTMFKGAGSYGKTRAFLKKAEAFAPDVIHLHNLHGSYINLPLLFRYIKKHRIPVVWTLHDCWAFTAICSHFSMAGCERWRSGCGKCPQKKRYASAPADLSPWVWRAKRAWFTGLPRAVIVTPSHWLETLAKDSFLGGYPVRRIPNGIDPEVFRETDSDFRRKHGLEGKKIVLGVAFDWSEAKGLDVFLELARRLPESCRIVLVGTAPETARRLPENVLAIPRTKDRRELAEIYTAADVFVNPTREEVLGLVNLEALACGTPVVTFDTGGSPECVGPGCGTVVPRDDVDAMEREIRRICTQSPYAKEDCRAWALEFDQQRCLRTYISLYRELAEEKKDGSQ